MHWFAVKHAIATNRKWMALSLRERSAWISLMAIAAASHPRGRLPDRATAVALLEREGADYAAVLLDSLISKCWIDDTVPLVSTTSTQSSSASGSRATCQRRSAIA